MKTTEDVSVAEQRGSGGRYLLVTSGKGLRAHALPARGGLVLGRDATCDLVVDDPKVSRRHARIDVGAAVTYTDLGSHNGTMHHGGRLPANQPVEMTAGQSFTIGSLALLLLPEGSSVSTAAGTTQLRVDDPSASTPSPMLVAVARSPMSVLIVGETGVGKEVLAGALHRLSGAGGPFLAVNCAAMSEPLLESELFGHERGSFTGALAVKPGLLETAAGGTVFLDEIGEMTPALQAKLLRATDAREIMRVGGLRPIAIDVRFLAATHRDVLASAFRKDLFYRLAAITLVIPPLRERRDRIVAIAVQLLRARAELTPDATATLVAHTWPGNVRELRNVLERALLLSGGGPIAAAHVRFDGAPPPAPEDLDEDAERQRIVAALEACAGNQTRAARQLGISRATLVHKLAVLRIPRPRKS